MKLHVKLSEVLRERGMTQSQLSKITGIREAAISEIVNNMRRNINRDHLERIATALNITDISELIVLLPDKDESK